MLTAAPYILGAELPNTTVTWKDESGAIIDLSAYTFQLTLKRLGSSDVVATKTTGITGGSADPNVTVSWAAGDLSAVTSGPHLAELVATRNADSKDRRMRFIIPFV